MTDKEKEKLLTSGEILDGYIYKHPVSAVITNTDSVWVFFSTKSDPKIFGIQAEPALLIRKGKD